MLLYLKLCYFSIVYFFREAEWRKYKFIFCISAWLPEKDLYFLFG